MVLDREESTDGLESLRTARLVLDKPRHDDLPDIIYLANNAKVAHMLAHMPHPYGIEDGREWIRRSRSEEPGSATFAIRLATTGRLIGACGYGDRNDNGVPQLGYWIGEPFWGNGYATEAAQTIIDHAFSVSNLDELWCCCRMTNPASRRVIEKCGFQYAEVGIIRSVALAGTVSVERYRLDVKAWAALKRWGAAS